MPLTFEQWWEANEKQYSADACHMSEYHMASMVWKAALSSRPEVERIEEAKRLLRVAGSANMGTTFPIKREIWIGWQHHGDKEEEEVRNFMRDLRKFLEGVLSPQGMSQEKP